MYIVISRVNEQEIKTRVRKPDGQLQESLNLLNYDILQTTAAWRNLVHLTKL